MHCYRLIVLVVTIANMQHIQAAAGDTIDFKTSEWPADKSLTIDPNSTVAHSIVLTDIEQNAKKSFQKLWKHAQRKHVPWVLLCERITLRDSSSFTQYSDAIEIIKKSGISYDKQNFASAESAHKTIREATNTLLTKLYPKLTMYQATEAYVWSSDFIDPHNGSYTITIKKASKKLSDISCTLAIRLCRDYSQLVPILQVLNTMAKQCEDKKIYYYDAHKRKDDILFKRKFWLDTLRKLPQKTQDRLIKEAKDEFASIDVK